MSIPVWPLLLIGFLFLGLHFSWLSMGPSMNGEEPDRGLSHGDTF